LKNLTLKKCNFAILR